MSFKYSLTSYSVWRLAAKEGYTDKDLLPLAKELGFDGMEYAGLSPAQGTDLLDHARELRAEADRVGIPIVALSVGSDLLNGGEGQIESLRRQVDAAAILGVKAMRHDASGGYPAEIRSQRGFENALPVIAEGYRKVTEYAKTKGVKTCIENHGFFCQDSTRVERIINAVADPNFGALVDIGNFLCADDDPGVAVGNLAPYAFHVHAKDFHVKPGTGFIPPDGFFMSRGGNFLRGAIIGHGDVPVIQCLRILRGAGYDGYITVEFEGMEDPVQGVTCGLNTLRAIEKIL